MADHDLKWVEAGARALHERYCACGKPDRFDRRNAEIAIAAVAPLIRAQVAAEMTVTHPAPVDEAALRAVRRETAEHIAQQIEAGCVHGRLVRSDMQGVIVSAPHEVCYRCQHAAEIARGGDQ